MNLDEISADFDEAMNFCKKNDLNFIELRTINGKNLVNFQEEEVYKLKKTIDHNGLKISAFASPLFKWLPYGYESVQPLYSVDTFNVPISLTYEDKIRMIEKTIRYCNILNVPNIRIFSCLKVAGLQDLPNEEYELLGTCSDLAKKHSIHVLLENEAVCLKSSHDDYVDLIEKLANIGIGSWYDLANFYEVGSSLYNEHFGKIAKHIKYIHVKDPTSLGVHKFVPLGAGYMNYKRLLPNLLEMVERGTFLSIETHAKTDKLLSSQTSIDYLKTFLKDDPISTAVYGTYSSCVEQANLLRDKSEVTISRVACDNSSENDRLSIIFDCKLSSSINDILGDKSIKQLFLPKTFYEQEYGVISTIKSTRKDLKILTF
jgi:sugar phosphate isomerase/epimerase